MSGIIDACVRERVQVHEVLGEGFYIMVLMILRRNCFLLALLLIAISNLARAGTAEFDLPGPRIEVRVTRAGKSLPIAQVPNLQPDDRLWLHPDLPAGQSVHYLLIAAFLRGSTNPPPDEWFTKAETWTKRVREEGIVVTVPKDAQQTLLFLAPETGGDFSTLRSAVRGKPGAGRPACVRPPSRGSGRARRSSSC